MKGGENLFEYDLAYAFDELAVFFASLTYRYKDHTCQPMLSSGVGGSDVGIDIWHQQTPFSKMGLIRNGEG
jgi:hypothetical protein